MQPDALHLTSELPRWSWYHIRTTLWRYRCLNTDRLCIYSVRNAYIWQPCYGTDLTATVQTLIYKRMSLHWFQCLKSLNTIRDSCKYNDFIWYTTKWLYANALKRRGSSVRSFGKFGGKQKFAVLHLSIISETLEPYMILLYCNSKYQDVGLLSYLSSLILVDYRSHCLNPDLRTKRLVLLLLCEPSFGPILTNSLGVFGGSSHKHP